MTNIDIMKEMAIVIIIFYWKRDDNQWKLKKANVKYWKQWNYIWKYKPILMTGVMANLSISMWKIQCQQ